MATSDLAREAEIVRAETESGRSVGVFRISFLTSQISACGKWRSFRSGRYEVACGNFRVEIALCYIFRTQIEIILFCERKWYKFQRYLCFFTVTPLFSMRQFASVVALFHQFILICGKNWCIPNSSWITNYFFIPSAFDHIWKIMEQSCYGETRPQQME